MDEQLSHFLEKESNEVLSKKKLSNLYSPFFLRLLQIIYGSEQIISQGGIKSIDHLFSNIDFDHKIVLDVGSGFGGIAIYLAKKHAAHIIGVDREPYMITKAQQWLTADQSSFKGKAIFQVLQEPTSLKEFSKDTFDIVYSKEMLYHVPIKDKQQYLQEMYRVLKPGGTLVIADWLHSGKGTYLKNMPKTEGFTHFVTPEEFKLMLEQANFCHINYRDASEHHIMYTKNDLARIQQSFHLICQELGNEAYHNSIKSWKSWLEALELRELLASIFIATK